jgi:hypothetical protein
MGAIPFLIAAAVIAFAFRDSFVRRLLIIIACVFL